MSTQVEVDGYKLDVPDEPSTTDLLMFGWENTMIPTQHIAAIAEQQFGDADPDVVRATQQFDKDKYLKERYPNIKDTPYEQSALSVASGFFKNLLDPVTFPLYFAPMLTPLKGAAIGGTTGAALMSLRGLAEDGEVDPTAVGVATALAATGGAVAGALGRSAANARNRDLATMGYAVTQQYKMYRDKFHSSPTQSMINAAKDFGLDVSQAEGLRQVARTRLERDAESAASTYAKMLRKGKDPLESPDFAVRRYTDAMRDAITTAKTANVPAEQLLPVILKQSNKAALYGEANPFAIPSRLPSWAGKYTGIVLDQIKRVAPTIHGKLVRTEQMTLDDIHKYYDRLLTGEKLFHKLPTTVQDQVKVALANSDDATVKSLVPTELYNAIHFVRKDVFAPIGQMAKEAGHKFTLLDDYWPRHYNDFKGFATKHNIATTYTGRDLEQLLDMYRSIKGLSDIEAQEKIRSYMTRANVSPLMVGRPSNLLERRIDKLDISDAKFLTDPFKAARVYVHDVVENYHKRKFFGLGAKDMPGYAFDLDKSIDGLLQRELLAKGLRLQDTAIVRKLLHARFGPGEQIPGKWNQRVKNIFYGATLGDPTSAITQLGDIGTSLAFNGVVNTLRAVFGKRVHMEDIGLRKLYEELSSTTRTAKWLDRVLTASGFNAIDKFGKSVYITAALHKLRNQVGSQRGLARFVSKYQPMFTPDELSNVINDLRVVRGIKPQQLNPNTRAVLFSELADVQPVIRSAMPEAYLNNPNGRMFYMLKTFVIRQMNTILSKTLYNPSGAEGTKNAIRVAMLLMGTGAGIDAVKRAASGKEVTLSDATVGSLLRTFTLSQYIANQAVSVSKKTGRVNIDIPRAAGLLFTPPPVSVGTEAIESGLSWLSDDPNAKVLRNIPFGRFLHDYVLGLSADKEK